MNSSDNPAGQRPTALHYLSALCPDTNAASLEREKVDGGLSEVLRSPVPLAGMEHLWASGVLLMGCFTCEPQDGMSPVSTASQPPVNIQQY